LYFFFLILYSKSQMLAPPLLTTRTYTRFSFHLYFTWFMYVTVSSAFETIFIKKLKKIQVPTATDTITPT
jgi:hypothetical protein